MQLGKNFSLPSYNKEKTIIELIKSIECTSKFDCNARFRERALETLDLSLPFYFRYVDNIDMAILSDSITKTLNNFNSFHPKLQFTIEIGGDRLNFLDVTIIKNNNNLEFNWYQKPTFSGRYLNYFFSTFALPKMKYDYRQVDRALLLSQDFNKKIYTFIINVFY